MDSPPFCERTNPSREPAKAGVVNRSARIHGAPVIDAANETEIRLRATQAWIKFVTAL
jgi:hypothetical protein